MGAKQSRERLTAIVPLSREVIDELCQDTGFTEEELLEWHRNFYHDCPDGKLTLKQFEHEYSKMMGKPTQKTANYIRHMFSVYDQDKNQYIDFKEFVTALSAASVVNRVRLVETLFHVFDLDGDGQITKEEIGKMLHTLADVTEPKEKHRSRYRHNGNHQESNNNKKIDFQKRIDTAFNELNANDDDHITKDEFIDWYMKSGLLTDVQTADLNATDPSRIPQIARKTRKSKKLPTMRQASIQDDNDRQVSYLARHMTRMIERKSSVPIDEDADDEDNNTTNSRVTRAYNRYEPPRRPNMISTTSHISNSDDDLHALDGGARWQFLFNSVLGGIRSQRQAEQEHQQTTTSNGDRHELAINRWRRSVVDSLEVKQNVHRPNGKGNNSHWNNIQLNRLSSNQSAVSDDILSIRL